MSNGLEQFLFLHFPSSFLILTMMPGSRSLLICHINLRFLFVHVMTNQHSPGCSERDFKWPTSMIKLSLFFCDILSLRAELFVLVFHQFVINKYTSRVDKVSGVEFKFFFIFLLTNRRRIVSLSLARRFIINTLNWTHFIHS